MAERRLFGIDPSADWRTQTRQASQAYERGDMSFPEFVAKGLAIPTRALASSAQEYVPDFVTDAVRGAMDLPGPRLFGAVVPELPSVQRAVAADQAMTEQFPEGYPRAKSFAGDVFTVGEVASGLAPVTRATGLLRAPSDRGMFLSSGPVYKRGHYNPTEIDLNSFEQFAADRLGLSEEAVNKYRKGKGTALFGLEGLGEVGRSMFNPTVRARYTEMGIPSIYDKQYKAYQKAVEGGDPKEIRSALEIAHNQMQAASNIKMQAGQVPKGENIPLSFAQAATDPNSPKPYFRPTEYGDNWYEQTAVPGATFGGFRPEDAKFIQDHVERVWAGKKGYNPDKTYITVKTPRSDVTGNHFRDVLSNNTSVTKITDVFRGGTADSPSFRSFDTVDDLKSELKKLETAHKFKTGEKAGQVMKDKLGRDKSPPIKVLRSDDTGVWIAITDKDAVVGSAKTEGGVNMLVKVEPDGNLTGVMSDAHNFYEEFGIPKTGVRVRNRPMEMALQDDVIAVTPPMQTNVVSVSRTGKFGDAAEELREAPGETMPVPARARQSEAKGLTEPRNRVVAAGEAQPSAGEIAAQTVPVVQNVQFLESLLGEYEEDPLAPSIR